MASAENAIYALDPVHTRVQFAISHAGFSQALGTVSGSTGTLLFDPNDWSSARIEVSVPITRLDLGDATWNTSALASNLLDGRDHPVATFASTRVEPIDAQHATVHGTLTLRGVAQDTALAVTFNQLKRHPLPPFRRTAGFSATTAISRKAFGISAWPRVIGDRVELRIEAEATRATAGAAMPDSSDTQHSTTPTDPQPTQGALSVPQAQTRSEAAPPATPLSEPTDEPTR
ncbi:MAG: YceI family protein [Luteimonas sp.]